MTEPVIDAERIARRYGRRWALAEVSFRVERGSVMMVAGRNGAGKSTLFRILSTAIRPDRGRARVCGFDVIGERQDVRRRTAILSHHNYLYEALTARENLAVVADHLGISRAGIPAALEQVALASRADDVMATFSAGMRKRLSFARVLLQEPEVVLLDEPYGALDPQGFDLVDGAIASLKRRGVTILLATHQWERASRYADVAMVLAEGRVSWMGPARDVLAHGGAA
ncbi:MAG TPA: heme ABC exporter ATP-binding protein CcmA [Thermoanaerobaculia bacterium]|jgi:heme exporter protein A